MRRLKILAVVVALSSWIALDLNAHATPPVAQPAATGACPSLLNQTFPRLQDDKPIDMCQYAGKVVLVVNTASYCGFTPQYKGLEALYRQYGPQGLVVLGFPSNDFNQEMKDPGKIAAFCRDTYDVQFPMFAPSHVTEPKPNDFYKKLIMATGDQPKWNFYKYLIGRNGKIAGVYSSLTTPENKDFVAKIQALLKQ
ncbi:glutathione peroxidase [Thiomonas delicata]|uniref:Glutathione peroxidase n=1 Tax=Thiomonas delicata TaxID=364030 RepID=A0A238D1T7_THIDL|nr:glutathione peroxidase [Thiomonas delicata]SBP87215.1 putative glutathione peroxidase [Thiomonas delicata]